MTPGFDSTASTPCPCGSGRAVAGCCGPILAGTTPAETAESLMRARYVAFTLGDAAFIEATLSPAERHDFDAAQVAETAKATWQGLEIRKAVAGGPGDDEGWVEFVARFRLHGKAVVHHERTRFVRGPAPEDGDGADGAAAKGPWLCDEAVLNPKEPPRSVAKVGRNDPCPCGSGKKYKKCCGA